MIILTDTEKAFEKIQHPLITIVIKVGIEVIYFNIIKTLTSPQPVLNTIPNSIQQ